MTDYVKWEAWERPNGVWWAVTDDERNRVISDRVAESEARAIETSRENAARVAELEADKSNMAHALKLKADEIKDLKIFLGLDEQRLATIEAENAKLKEALKPFKDLADELDDAGPDEFALVDLNMGQGHVVTNGDLRRAASALEGEGHDVKAGTDEVQK